MATEFARSKSTGWSSMGRDAYGSEIHTKADQFIAKLKSKDYFGNVF